MYTIIQTDAINASDRLYGVEVITSDFDTFRSSGNPGSSPGTTFLDLEVKKKV